MGITKSEIISISSIETHSVIIGKFRLGRADAHAKVLPADGTRCQNADRPGRGDQRFQSADFTLAVTQTLFDSVSEYYPSAESLLSLYETIVMKPGLESGIVKIQQDRCLQLCGGEKMAVEWLVLVSTQTNLEKVGTFR